MDRRRGYTLIELLLVAALMGVLAVMILPRIIQTAEDQALQASARRMRSLIETILSQAQYDGIRYRIRIPEADELDGTGDDRQPIIERELEPLENPDEWTPIKASWAQDEIFLEDVWCIQVRLGRPTVERILNPDDTEVTEELLGIQDDFEPELPPLIFEPDGTAPWATFVLTEADRDLSVDELDDEVDRIEVIFEGPTGMVWLQRAFQEEELRLFEDNGWPIIQRRDFLDKRILTEDDVLELMEDSIAPNALDAIRSGSG